jgi:hypothetical protein
MPEVSVALNESPGELIFEPTAFPSRTVRVLPTGTITGCGAGAGADVGADAASGAAAVAAEDGVAAGDVAGADGEFIAFPESVFIDPEFVDPEFAGAEFAGGLFAGAAVLLVEFAAVSAGFREHAANVNSRKMEIHRARARMGSSSEREFVEVKTVIEAGQACK